jgi:2,4-dienoyl-CoA reductase-like NADH-dependent reductase (Old Yellow Enzyme family)
VLTALASNSHLEVVITTWGRQLTDLSPPSPNLNYTTRMPLDETLATFSHFVKEVNALDLAYVCLVRYWAEMDPKRRGTDHDVIEAYSPLITSPTKKVSNCGFTPDEADRMIKEGNIDAVEFGMLWITHPDLARRVQERKPLDTKPNVARLYGKGGKTLEELVTGYTDYPEAVY